MTELVHAQLMVCRSLTATMSRGTHVHPYEFMHPKKLLHCKNCPTTRIMWRVCCMVVATAVRKWCGVRDCGAYPVNMATSSQGDVISDGRQYQ